MTITLHSCPPHRVQSVLNTLNEYNVLDADTDDRTNVIVGESYNVGEIRVGCATELADDLMQRAPEVAFIVYEDPAYEYLGTTCLYVSGLGLFTADCGPDGEPVLTLSEILQLDNEPADVRQAKLGLPWLTAIAAMNQNNVNEPDRTGTDQRTTTPPADTLARQLIQRAHVE